MENSDLDFDVLTALHIVLDGKAKKSMTEKEEYTITAYRVGDVTRVDVKQTTK